MITTLNKINACFLEEQQRKEKKIKKRYHNVRKCRKMSYLWFMAVGIIILVEFELTEAFRNSLFGKKKTVQGIRPNWDAVNALFKRLSTNHGARHLTLSNSGPLLSVM